MKRIISVMMLLVMVFSLFTIGHAAPESGSTIIEPEQVGEVLGLREKNSETYRLEDGSYECVVFAENKYFEDETGKLVEISNTVVPEKHTIAGKEYGFTNEANSNRIYFSEDEPSVLVSTGKQDLAFNIVTDRAVTPVIGGLKDVGEIAEYSLSGDTCFAYMNAFEHTDLVYKVRNGMLKEYIVLNDASAPREFTFTFDTEGYTVAYTEYGTVGFYDGEGELVFELGDLFAVDSADALTDELAYTIGEKIEGKTEITVTLSEDYAADPERAYPILVDPSVVISGTNSIQDSFVSSKNPTNNYYTSNYIRMGWDSNYNVRRTYIRFDLPASIPSGAITESYMSLKKYDCGNAPSLKAYRVTGSWTSNAITWDNKPGYTSTNASATAEERNNNWYRFYVTDIVKMWYAGTYQNYGFLVKNSTESGTGNWSTFYSSDADSPNKPELRITYSSDGTSYYMAFPTDGKMITSNSACTLSKTSFSNGNSYQQWVFSPVSNGVYTIRMKNNLNKCLTAVSGALAVTISDVAIGDSNQYWSVLNTSDTSAICSSSSNSNLSGKRIYYNGSSFMLCDGACDSLKRLASDTFTPCTAIYVSPMTLNSWTNRTITPSFTPANASATSHIWTAYSSSDTSVFTVDSNGSIHAKSYGIATLTVRNKITNVSCTASIKVNRPPDPDVQNKTYWCWAAAAKKVVINNAESTILSTGAIELVNSDGLHGPYYGIMYNGTYTADAGQREIVYNEYGNDENHGASELSQIESALFWASDETVSTFVIGNGTTALSTLRNELTNGRWVVGALSTWVDPLSTSRHAVVFTTYNAADQTYSFWDPWNGCTISVSENQLNQISLHGSDYWLSNAVCCH